MEDIIKIIVDNGVSVVICGAFLYYVFKQQRQNEENTKLLNEMYQNLILINEKLGIKLKSSKKKEDE
jgi:hypothetical protein